MMFYGSANDRSRCMPTMNGPVLKTFKIRLPSPCSALDSVRRMTFPTDAVSLESLASECQHLFSLPEGRPWHFKWRDADGDMITMTEPRELEDLLRLQVHEPVINLVIHVLPEKPSSARCERQAQSRQPWVQHIKIRVPMPMSRPAVFKLESQAGTGCPRQHGHHHDGHHGHRVPADQNALPTHPRCYTAICDVTNQVLKVGHGWYHRVGSNFDMCEQAYQGLDDSAKTGFVRIDKPADLGDEQRHYVAKWPRRMCRSHTPTVKDTETSQKAPESSNNKPSNDKKETIDETRCDEKDAILRWAESVANDFVDLLSRSLPSQDSGSSSDDDGSLVVTSEADFNKNVPATSSDAVSSVVQEDYVPVSEPVDEPVVVNDTHSSNGSIDVRSVVEEDSEDETKDEEDEASVPVTLSNQSMPEPQPEPLPRAPAEPFMTSSRGGEYEAEVVQTMMEMGLGDALTCLSAIRRAGGDVNAAAMELLRQ